MRPYCQVLWQGNWMQHSKVVHVSEHFASMVSALGHSPGMSWKCCFKKDSDHFTLHSQSPPVDS